MCLNLLYNREYCSFVHREALPSSMVGRGGCLVGTQVADTKRPDRAWKLDSLAESCTDREWWPPWCQGTACSCLSCSVAAVLLAAETAAPLYSCLLYTSDAADES